MKQSKTPYVDEATGLPVRCPMCQEPINWTGRDWFCPACSYLGLEALYPEPPLEDVPVVRHPQPPEREILLNLDPLSAAYLQRLSRKLDISPAEAVVIVIKKAAKAEFSPKQKEQLNGTHEIRDP